MRLWYTSRMGKITDIKPQVRNKNRVSLYVDGEFFCGLEKLTVLSHRLHIGDEVDTDTLKEATAESERTTAFEKAVQYLGVRPRTEREMRTYLSGKEFSADTVDATVEKLCNYGYVNDAEFCRMYIEAYGKKSGVRKLRAELRAKGVAGEIIDNALSEMNDRTDAVVRLAEKYLSSHARDKRKVYAYLMGRGFEYDTIRQALNDMDWQEDD